VLGEAAGSHIQRFSPGAAFVDIIVDGVFDYVLKERFSSKGALDAPLQGHDGGVCAATAQVSGEMSCPSEVTKVSKTKLTN